MWNLKAVEKETLPNCQHCGAAIKYVCWIENDETGGVLGVGRQCCGNFMRRVPTKEIEIRIDTINAVEKARCVIAKYSGEAEKRVAYRVYLALKGNVTLMVESFPALARALGY